MDISLIHAGLAAGAGLAAVPVILHLFMKQTPKRVMFPALRLIRERQKRSKQKLRVKNWLLLLARMALVALMALALARPSVNSQTKLGDQEVPTAVGLVFDTSLSMGYKERDRTRLDEAKERAAEILKKLPDTSQVFVIDSADQGVPASLSPAAARKRIDGLTLRAANHSLNKSVGLAYSAIAESDRPRHEVYVLTDLARTSWDLDRRVEGLDKVKAIKSGVNTYVLRLAPKEVHNVSVTEAEPSASIAGPGEPVEIRARFTSKGAATERFAEIWLDNILREKKPIKLAADGETSIRFMTPKPDPAIPLHQGKVVLTGAPDPLEFDDVRYFSFRVQPTMKALLVSDLAIDAEFVSKALDPDPATLPEGSSRTCQAQAIRSSQFTNISKEMLRDFTVVFLLNVSELDDDAWGRLNAYVREGGGLVIGLGDRCEPESYNRTAASQLLPATVVKAKKPTPPTSFGKLNDVTHPLFQRYHKELETYLSQIPIYAYWQVTLPEGSRTLMTFADNAPALLERTFRGLKTGRVLVWATPLAHRSDPQDPARWNEFPNPLVGWTFMYLMNQTVPYMAGASSERLNYEAGQDVTLPIDPTKRYKNYIVESPDKRNTDRLSPPVTSDQLVIVSPQPMGQWKVEADGPGIGKAVMGFSVNPPAREIKFDPLVSQDLDSLFGKDGYHLAKDAASLSTEVTGVRVGFEMFPYLMFLIMLLVTAESVLANRFYRESQTRPAGAAA